MSTGYEHPGFPRRPTVTSEITIAATATPQRVTTSRTPFRALQAWAPAGNAGDISIGWSETFLPLVIPAGQSASWPGLDQKDLSDMWVSGTEDDTVSFDRDGDPSSEAS